MIYSPLRYPCGKRKLIPQIKEYLQTINQPTKVFVEPFCGGASVGLDLLITGQIEKLVINDMNKGIYSFWSALLTETEKLINKIIIGRRFPSHMWWVF